VGFALASRADGFDVGRVKATGIFLLLVGLLAPAGLRAQRAEEPIVQASEWHGYRRLDFTLAGRPCLLVQPKTAAAGNPWIWRMEFFDTEPQADLALLARGWHVAYMNAQDMYGAPKAMELFGQFYAHLVTRYDLAQRVVLEGFSRGGLYAFNFAAAHPTRVAAMYLDGAALDIKSWPGRHRDSKEWRECLAAYHLTEETLPAFRRNPIDLVPAVIVGRIPILAVSGDADESVPFQENTAELERRYKAAGGLIQVIVKPGGKHHPHSLPDPAPIVDFILKNAKV
jgi:pimeloyl-ACP methyl ester carboxylesterase